MSFDPQPTNPLGWLIILLLGFAFFFVAGSESQSVRVMPEVPVRPQTRGAGAGRDIPMPVDASLLYVESVETIVRESFPPQITLTVHGNWPDGCSAEPQSQVVREGDTIIVRIFRRLPPDVMCTMVLTPATVEVSITDALMENGAFRSGEYTIDVNGVLVQAAF